MKNMLKFSSVSRKDLRTVPSIDMFCEDLEKEVFERLFDELIKT